MNIEEEIRELKKRNGNGYVKNNDLLWFIIKKLDSVEDRVSKTEAIQKMMLWAIPVVIGLSGLIAYVI